MRARSTWRETNYSTEIHDANKPIEGFLLRLDIIISSWLGSASANGGRMFLSGGPACLRVARRQVTVSSGFPIEAFGNDGLLEVWEWLLPSKLRRINP